MTNKQIKKIMDDEHKRWKKLHDELQKLNEQNDKIIDEVYAKTQDECPHRKVKAFSIYGFPTEYFCDVCGKEIKK